jgi:hypothetical protein
MPYLLSCLFFSCIQQTELVSCVSDLISEFSPYPEKVPPNVMMERIRETILSIRIGGEKVELSMEDMSGLWEFEFSKEGSRTSRNDEDVPMEEEEASEHPNKRRKRNKTSEFVEMAA